MTREQLNGAEICGLLVVVVLLIIGIGCAVTYACAAAVDRRHDQLERFGTDTERAVVEALQTVAGEPVDSDGVARAVAAFNAAQDELAARRDARAGR